MYRSSSPEQEIGVRAIPRQPRFTPSAPQALDTHSRTDRDEATESTPSYDPHAAGPTRLKLTTYTPHTRPQLGGPSHRGYEADLAGPSRSQSNYPDLYGRAHQVGSNDEDDHRYALEVQEDGSQVTDPWRRKPRLGGPAEPIMFNTEELAALRKYRYEPEEGYKERMMDELSPKW